MSEVTPQVPTESDKEKFDRLFPYVREYQALASKFKINDIFQDNGGKYLQLLMILGLTTDGAREGNDAIDADGNEYEIKTVNLDLQHQFTTHHHMNPVIIAKYRKVDWYFAAFKNIELQVIYRLKPEHMEPFYQRWEQKWHDDGGKDINNPKIPLTYVMANGEVIWLPEGSQGFIRPKLIKDPNRPVRTRKKKSSAALDASLFEEATVKIACSLCHGRGGDVEINCPNCNGSGYDPNEDNPFAQCHSCYGDGTVQADVCPNCSGEGTISEEAE